MIVGAKNERKADKNFSRQIQIMSFSTAAPFNWYVVLVFWITNFNHDSIGY